MNKNTPPNLMQGLCILQFCCQIPVRGLTSVFSKSVCQGVLHGATVLKGFGEALCHILSHLDILFS